MANENCAAYPRDVLLDLTVRCPGHPEAVRQGPLTATFTMNGGVSAVVRRVTATVDMAGP